MLNRSQCGLTAVILGLAIRAIPLAALPAQATAASQQAIPASSSEPVPTPRPDERLVAMLDRVGRYVVEYEGTFRDLVAEEASTQWAGEPRGTTDAPAPRRRSLRSDMVFTTLPGALPWGCFRDVFEVDGQKVHDREPAAREALRQRELRFRHRACPCHPRREQPLQHRRGASHRQHPDLPSAFPPPEEPGSLPFRDQWAPPVPGPGGGGAPLHGDGPSHSAAR